MAQTLCSSGQVLLLVKNISSDWNTKSSVDWDDIINRKESVINAVSRFNWVTNFTKIKTSGQQLILTETCAVMVALDLVDYDQNSLTSRTEAENLINVLRDIKLFNLSLLRDQKTVDFINE